MHRQHKGGGKKKKKEGEEKEAWKGGENVERHKSGARGERGAQQQHVLRSRRAGSARGRLLPARMSTGKQPALCPTERGPQPLLLLV